MKKSFAVLFTAVLVVFGVATSEPALAHGRVHFGVFIGGPLFWPGPYYYPPVYVAPPLPPQPVYIERQVAPPPPPEWFFCEDSKTFYPYVKECPGGWQRVPAQSPSPPR